MTDPTEVSVSTFGGSPAEWDAFVSDREGWTPFHSWAWRRVVEEVHGLETPYLAASDAQGALRAALPLVRVASPVFGRFLVSMPHVNYGGPVGDPEPAARLAEAAAAMAREEGADLLELRSRAPVPAELEVSHRRITVVLDLPEEPGTLWDGLDSKVRNQVRKPRKEGVEVRFGLDQLGPFHRVYARHMRDLGTPAQPRALFEATAEAFPERAWFGCAWYDGRPVAGGCGLRWSGEFEMTWASDLMDYRSVAPNMLLYWSFMERACEEGLERFNFGRCRPDSGTHRFKRQWGTRDEQLWWYQWSAGDTSAPPTPDDDAWSWGPRLWRKLPIPLATALGPRIVRYIP